MTQVPETTKKEEVSTTKEKEVKGNWIAVESNPKVCNDFCSRMGMPSKFKWGDVYGFDETPLSWVPQPVVACVLLRPSSKAAKEYKLKQQQLIEKNGQELDKQLFYLYQHDKIGNACGTIAMLHVLSNTKEISLKDKSPLANFINTTSSQDWTQRGWSLVKDKNIQEVSDKSASSKDNQTNTPNRTDKTSGHFIAFIKKNNVLYELDGRKKFPINHGKTNDVSFIQDVGKIVREQFIAQDSKNPYFSLMALSKVDF